MTVMRIVLAPSVAKPVVAAVDELVRRIAETPLDTEDDGEPQPSADSLDQPSVSGPSPTAVESVDRGEATLSADSVDQPSVMTPSPTVASVPEVAIDSLPATLREMRRRWQPDTTDGWVFPSLGRQRADAFVALFLGCAVELTTEVVVHVRGDGITFDDGTPTTSHAVLRQLGDSFIRLLIHDAGRRPINASSRQRHATTRQKRVVMEAHGHECVDCQSTELLELDHNPAYEQTRHTVTDELEPRCAPCHRARHRNDPTTKRRPSPIAHRPRRAAEPELPASPRAVDELPGYETSNAGRPGAGRGSSRLDGSPRSVVAASTRGEAWVPSGCDLVALGDVLGPSEHGHEDARLAGDVGTEVPGVAGRVEHRVGDRIDVEDP